MSVTLSPAQSLGFPRPLTSLVKRTLAVSNSNSQPVAFKVKTTAPKQYCVRPNSGRIEPGETVLVQVLLQPMKEDPAPGAKCRDKFLVQSVVITPERETNSLPELWSTIEKEDKATTKELAAIHEQKIRCTYLPAEDHDTIPEEAAEPTASAMAAGGASATGSDGDESHFKASTTSPSDVSPPSADADMSLSSMTADTSYSTIAPENGSSFIEHVNGVSHEKGILAGAGVAVAGAAAVVGSKFGAGSAPSSEAPAKAIPSIPRTVVTESSSSAIPAVSSKLSRSAEVEAVESQLAQARREIESLKAQLATATANELRQRKSGTTATTSATAIQHPGSVEGVPVQVALSLVAATFVFTWLFF